MITEYSRFTAGDMLIRFLRDSESGTIGLQILPLSLEHEIKPHRRILSGRPEYRHLPARYLADPGSLIPLVSVNFEGDTYTDGFGQGLTMAGSSSAKALVLEHQGLEEREDGFRIETRFSVSGRFSLSSYLDYSSGTAFLRSWSAVRNTGGRREALNLLTSFSLGNITPFADDDAPGRLSLHRMRSFWSAEGRHEAVCLEDLGIERSWSGHGIRCERFGQAGSMPVRAWVPLAAIEDREAGVFWGAQIHWAGSWQMEVFRRQDYAGLSGGLADYDFGHFRKLIGPGSSFETPVAVLSVVQGDFDELCERLVAAQIPAAEAQPDAEADLPIIFNEWCTSWGKPSHETMNNIAECLADLPVGYLVMDAGWFARENGSWDQGQGDWIPSPALFPQGLASAAADIRSKGLIPGLWFEFEVIGKDSEAWNRTELQLHRNGVPLQSGDRRFWDFRKEEVHEYLEERVIDLIEENGIGYLKVDYNETTGIGADGGDSFGEALYEHILGVLRFFERIRRRLPQLVIENCSSGGHRIEPLMVGLTSMSSFSDAHEPWEIPIIAANLQRIILPRQSQVWSVIRAEDNERRLVYSLSANFLGRMCLSGDIMGIDEKQREILSRAVKLYRSVWPIVKAGSSRRYGNRVKSYRYPEGYQAIVRQNTEGTELLIVFHSFLKCEERLHLLLPKNGWSITSVFLDQAISAECADGENLILTGIEPLCGGVIHLKKRQRAGTQL